MKHLSFSINADLAFVQNFLRNGEHFSALVLHSSNKLSIYFVLLCEALEIDVENHHGLVCRITLCIKVDKAAHAIDRVISAHRCQRFA